MTKQHNRCVETKNKKAGILAHREASNERAKRADGFPHNARVGQHSKPNMSTV